MRVMSFNIRCASANDGVNNWVHRQQLNIDVIRQVAPDVVGFQELQEEQWQTYLSQLAGYERLRGPAYNNDRPWFAWAALFWRSDRFALIDQGGFWLSPTPHVHSDGWNTACIRCAHWVKLRSLPHPQLTLTVLNTHLDHRSEEARREGAALIAQRLDPLQSDGSSLIVMGDFNCDESSDAHHTFTRRNYRCALTEAGLVQPDAFTFHRFTGQRVASSDGGHEAHIIDWIFYRPGTHAITLKQAQIIRSAQPPLFPSDHYPVVAEFENRS